VRSVDNWCSGRPLIDRNQSIESCVCDSTGTQWQFSDAVQVASEGSPSAEPADTVARTFAAVEAARAVRDTDLGDLVAASPSPDLVEARVWEVGQSAIADLALVADTGFVRLEVEETRPAAVLAVVVVVVDDAAGLVGSAATWTVDHFGSTVQAAMVTDTL